MKRILLLLSLILSSQAFSQINFENGYFIKNDNSKVNCFIRNVGWLKNPTIIEYKLNESEPSQEVTIADIKEFNVGEQYKYVRFNTKIDRSSSSFDLMRFERNPVFKEEMLFLKLLVEGEINLYEYKDSDITRYFISSGNHSVVEQLVYLQFRIDNAIAENNYFRQQLTVDLKSDILTAKDFKNLPYKKKELVAIIEKYDNSKGLKSTNFEIKQNQEFINLRVFAGVNLTSLSISNQLLYSYKNVKFDSKAVFVIGLEAEVILPFNQNKWSLFIDPNFQYYNGKATTKDGKIVEADYKFIEFPIGARYSFFMQNKSQIFINAGVTFSVDFNANLTSNSTEQLDINATSNFFAGVGYRKNNFGFEVRYNTNRGILFDYPFWKSNYGSVGILASYKFL